MADKKISEFDSFQGTQDSKVHYIISSGDAGGQDTDNYKVSFPDLVLSVSGELKDSLGGGGVPGPGGSFDFGPTDPSNNTDVVNFNQGENVRMYIDQDGAVNVSEKLIVSDGKETILGGVTTIKGATTINETLTVADGKETILGGNTTIKETLTVADGKQTTLGGPVTIKGDSTFEQSAIFTDLTTDPDPSTGKLYRKGDDIYFGGQKLLTDGSSGAGKWSDGTTAGQIHYSAGNVGIGINAPTAKLYVSRSDQSETDSALTVLRGDTSSEHRPTAPIFNVINGEAGGTEVFRIQGSGNVGIGETNPAEQLVVKNQSTTNNKVTIGLSSKDGTQNGAFSHIHEAGAERITLSAGGFNTDHLAILNNGNVGIGAERASSTSAAVPYNSITPLQINKPGDEIVPLLTLSNYDHTDDSTNHGAALNFGLARDTGTQLGDAGQIYVGKAEAWKDTNDDFINSFMSFNILTKMGSSEKLRITSEGVGIGTTDPGARLEVSNASNTISTAKFYNAGGTAPATVHIIEDGAAPEHVGLFVGKSDRSSAFLMTKQDKVGIGTDPSYRFHALENVNDIVGAYFENSAARPYGLHIEHSNAVGTQTGPSSGYFLNCESLDNAGGTSVPMFSIANNGNASNRYNTYGAISDIKLKENIVDATPKTEDLKQVRVVNFNFKNSPDDKQIGVIAQELEDVFPGMVYETEDLEDRAPTGETSKAVKYSVFVPMLVKAFQEQQAIIEDLKSRIETLEN